MGYKVRITVLLFSLFSLSCGSDAVSDCFEAAGKAISYEITVSDFTDIHISEGIELIVRQGEGRQVMVKTDANLKGGISAEVADGTLYLRNATGCNWVRKYNITKIYVTTPQLEKIYSGSQFAVRSEGVLAFPSLTLQSGIFSETASGTFELEVNCETLTIDDNQAAYYKISGTVDNLSVNFYAGDARFDGSSLIAQTVHIFQRSSNDIIVNPQQGIYGTIYSTGNVLLENTPPVIEVDRLYKGRLIFE